MAKQPKRVLDLFCGAGGITKGLQRAGFHVTGVDNKLQPRYCGDRFILGDAMTVSLDGYDAFFASPVCKRYSQCTPPQHRAKWPDLIGPVRDRLLTTRKPFVIENVPSAKRRLINPILLCGSMFGLLVRRHRFFEVHGFSVPQMECDHIKSPVLITGTHRRTYEPRYEYTAQQCREASELFWMTRKEMDEAIPPAYSEFIGWCLNG